MSSNGDRWETSDLGVAAYVHMKGLEILGGRRDRNRRWVFRFKDPDRRARSIAMEYLNSECRAFDAAIRTLKKTIDIHRKEG